LVIGRGEHSAISFEEKTGHDVIVGGLSKFLDSSPTIPKAAIVAVDVEHLCDLSTDLLKYGVKNILVEKPAGLKGEEIESLHKLASFKQADIFVAYNRRFFSSVIKARDLIASDGGVRSFNFEFTEWGHVIGKLDKSAESLNRWFIANSTHVVDLAFYLGGEPSDISCFSGGGVDWHQVASKFSGAGMTTGGATFCYQADWESAGRWSVEILTSENRYIFRPMEALSVQRRGTVVTQVVDIDDSLDKEFKPGLYLQVEAFLNNRTEQLCSLSSQHNMMATYEKIAGYAS